MNQQLNFNELLVVASDPSERKHGGNPQSVDAHQKVAPLKMDTYKRIIGLLKARGEYGATSKEIAAAFGVQLNCLSGRFSELKQMGWVKESGERRHGAAVLLAK